MATTNQFLQGIYIAYWGRAADPEGLNYWKGQVPTLGLIGVAENFAASAEGMDAYPYFSKYFLGLEVTQADREEFVEQIYMNLFNREVESEEVMEYWTGVLTDGEYSPGRFIADIMNTALVNGEEDGDTVMAKMAIAEYFTDQLVAQGVEWTPALSDEMTAIIAQVDNETTAEEMQAFRAEADAIVHGGVPTDQFVLTPAVDNFVGGAGDDKFLATHQTLTANDRLDGGGGENTLEFAQSSTNAAQDFGGFFTQNIQNMRITNDAGVGGTATFDMNGVEGLEFVEVFNSRNEVRLMDVRSLVDIKLNDITNPNVPGAFSDIAFEFQNALLTGDDDTVNVELAATNRTNSEINSLTLGSTRNPNADIENLNFTVTGENTWLRALDSRITNLTITGDGTGLQLGELNESYLANSLRNLDSTEFEGDLNTFIGDNTLENVALSAQLGAGDDVLVVAGGRLDVDLGAGDDTIIFDTLANTTNNHGFRADDSVAGGEGTDTLQLGWFHAAPNAVNDLHNWAVAGTPGEGNFVLSTTEFNNKGSLEVIDVRAANTNMTLSQRFVDSADETLIITTDMVNEGWAPNSRELAQANLAEQRMVTTLDTTALGQNTPLVYVGGDGSDRIVLNDATFNSAINLDGGSNYNVDSPDAIAGDYDTLNIVGGATRTVIDAADLTNVRNFEGMNLVKSGATTTIDLVLTQAFLNANTQANNDGRTSINDSIFQIFTARSENGATLTAGDIVNVEMDRAVFDAIVNGRGFDYSSLIDSGAQVNFTINNANATVAERAAILGLTDVVGQPDVIASRANPVAEPNITLIAEAAGFDTTSGFMIANNTIATTQDNILQSAAGFLDVTATINMGDGNNTLEITTAVDVGNVGGVNVALAGAINVNEVVLTQGSTANVVGAANQNITAEAASIFTLGAGARGTGSDFADTIFAHNGGSVIDAGAGDDTVFAGLGNDTITALAGDNTIFVTGGNDRVTLGDGDDTVFVNLGDTEVHTVTLGGGADIVYIGNPVFTNADQSRVVITDFSLADDRVSLNNEGNDVSFGTFHNDVGINSNINLANAGILEIDGNAFQYVNVFDTASLLNHVNNTSGITANLGAEVTVVSYNNAGNAAVYIATSTINNNQLDNVELVGIMEGIGINGLTSSNFM